MLGENSLETNRFGRHQHAMLQNARALVAMHYIDLFTNKNLPDQRGTIEKREECHVPLNYWSLWDVVDFEAIRHISDAFSGVLILICDEAHLMPPFDKTLCQLITVGFDASKFRKGEIRTDEYLVALIECIRDI